MENLKESEKPLSLRTYWQSVIEEWKTSGQTQRKYCLDKSLKPHQLSYWYRRLVKESTRPSFELLGELKQQPSTCKIVVNEVKLEFPSGTNREKVIAVIRCLI